MNLLSWNSWLYLFSDFLNSASLVKGSVTGIMPMDQSKSPGFHQRFQTDQVVGIKEFGNILPDYLEKNKQEKPNMRMNVVTFGKATGKTMPQNQLTGDKLRAQKMTQHDSNVHVKSTNVFGGKTFCFSNLFPAEKVRKIMHKLFTSLYFTT